MKFFSKVFLFFLLVCCLRYTVMPVLWLKPYEARRIKKQRTLRRNNKSDPVSTAVPSTAVPSTAAPTAAPTLAQARTLKTIIIVLSRREAFEERQVIRDTWAMGHTNVFFIVGKPCEIPLEYRKPWVCERKSVSQCFMGFAQDGVAWHSYIVFHRSPHEEFLVRNAFRYACYRC